MRRFLPFLALPLLPFLCIAQSPEPALVGYWQNWNDANCPYVSLPQVNNKYNVIEIAFAIPKQGTTYDMEFTPDGTTQGALVTDIQALQGAGKKVLISIGGATATVALNDTNERNTFVTSMENIIQTYGLDGFDIDLEGSSVSISGGSVTQIVDAKITHLVEGIRRIMAWYRQTYGRKLFLSFAPETAYVQGGMSSFGGIWGAYLPILDALRDSIEILQVQLYNSGSMYGIDQGIYTQGTADFIVSQTEAVLQGFNTSGGAFAGFRQDQVAIGLPACPSAAGGGYVTPAVLKSAVRYLQGVGPKPGSYTRVSTYPNLRGLMTWSINWDMTASCGTANEYSDTWDTLFGGITTAVVEQPVQAQDLVLFPNPARAGQTLRITHSDHIREARLYSVTGRLVVAYDAGSGVWVLPSDLSSGMYMVEVRGREVRR
ncbi:MAG: T9SS type A sorting domain-containing protein, partial [Flavobacteriales bacterium]|nr:T9SS type A sorting domain-containing protein [Flavobacteriales bacterium]